MIVDIRNWHISRWADRRSEMLRWCYENYPTYKVSVDRMIWEFEKEEDALLFILTWHNAK